VKDPLTAEHKICSVTYSEGSATDSGWPSELHFLANMHLSRQMMSRFWFTDRAEKCWPLAMSKIRRLRKKIELGRTYIQICNQHSAINTASKCATAVGHKPVPATARSKARVCCRWHAGIVGSNPAGDIDVCLLW